MRLTAALFLFGLSVPAVQAADDVSFNFDGHTKLRYTYQSNPDNSVFYDLVGSSANDGLGELRLNFKVKKSRFDFKAGYQFFGAYGDQIEIGRQFPGDAGLLFGRAPTDERRLFDLTDVIEDEDKTVAVQRLDRLSVGYTGEKAVLRFGRQTISWGNGLFFAPMDIVNPFDPSAVDTEYKLGDDMLLGQYLQDNGNDTQAAVVFRRDVISGDVESDQATAAIKYHGSFLWQDSMGEYDLLAAKNYGDVTVGLGGNLSLGGAVLRGDVVVTDTETENTVAMLVGNYSYSWVWGGKNVSGAVEYFYNGFGQRDGDYSDLDENTELLERIARGELFTLGRHYLAGSLMIEMTPLWQLTPNVFANLSDGSALAQVVTQHSLQDNLTLLGALNVPVGSVGTEYGGLPTPEPGKYLSYDLSFFLQLAWYF